MEIVEMKKRKAKCNELIYVFKNGKPWEIDNGVDTNGTFVIVSLCTYLEAGTSESFEDDLWIEISAHTNGKRFFYSEFDNYKDYKYHDEGENLFLDEVGSDIEKLIASLFKMMGSVN